MQYDHTELYELIVDESSILCVLSIYGSYYQTACVI